MHVTASVTVISRGEEDEECYRACLRACALNHDLDILPEACQYHAAEAHQRWQEGRPEEEQEEATCGFDNFASSRCTRCAHNNKTCGTVSVCDTGTACC